MRVRHYNSHKNVVFLLLIIFLIIIVTGIPVVVLHPSSHRSVARRRTACVKTRVKHGDGNIWDTNTHAHKRRRTHTRTHTRQHTRDYDALWDGDGEGRVWWWWWWCWWLQRNKPANYNVNVKMSDCRQRDGGDDHNYITRLYDYASLPRPSKYITNGRRRRRLCSNAAAASSSSSPS